MKRDIQSGVEPILFGILGGMGPLASAEFLRQLVEFTPASCDQEHLPVMLRSVPQIPDRTSAIHGHGPSPLPALLDGVQALIDAGVCEIAIPCNTAHYWHADLRTPSHVRIVHICDVVLDRLNASVQKGASVGILATTGTLVSNLYSTHLSAYGYKVMQPTVVDQRALVEAGIAATKAGRLEAGSALLRRAAEGLLGRGADVLLLACTEISVALGADKSLPSIDAGKALAEYCANRWHAMLIEHIKLTEVIKPSYSS
jgi:aspartate racemase